MTVIDHLGNMKDRRMALAFLYKYGESTCFFTCTHTRTEINNMDSHTYLAYVDWSKLFLVSLSCHCIRTSIGDLMILKC
jgi:hypothetical protein